MVPMTDKACRKPNRKRLCHTCFQSLTNILLDTVTDICPEVTSKCPLLNNPESQRSNPC
jgi:hypothetical protein